MTPALGRDRDERQAMVQLSLERYIHGSGHFALQRKVGDRVAGGEDTISGYEQRGETQRTH